MKKKNIIIIVVIAVALLLIIGGIIFVSSGEKEPKEIKENRDYKTVVENAPTTEGEMSSVEQVQESFEEDAKDIGFEKAECKDGNCLATNKGYTNADQEDVINVAKDEYGDPTMVVVMHFHKNDCTADNVYTKLNAASNNYFGTKVSKEDIQKMINDMESASDKYGSILLTSGEYTLDLSIQYVDGTDFRIVKYRVLTTKLYNEYQGA